MHQWFIHKTCLFDLLSSSLMHLAKLCLPPMYIPIESSPNDQIQPKLFVLINSTNIYIPSDKFIINRSIFMEVWFNIFPGSSRSFRLFQNMPRRCAIPRDNPKFFWKIRNWNHIIMTMGMYWIEPLWILICLIQIY
jgi:hypothetical protein